MGPEVVRRAFNAGGRDMGRKCRYLPSCFIPIVNNKRVIVGWTDTAPKCIDAALRHADAEKLVGPLKCLYVQIDAAADKHRAGAPAGWIGPWRCLALCGADVLARHPDVLSVASKPRISAIVAPLERPVPGHTAPPSEDRPFFH